MPATARTATQLTHTALATLLADPGTAADTTNNDSFPNGGVFGVHDQASGVRALRSSTELLVPVVRHGFVESIWSAMP
jgi:hypothetical protein